jgi:hypothetical protein
MTMFYEVCKKWNSIFMQSESLTKLELRKEGHKKIWQRFNWLTWRGSEQVRQKKEEAKCHKAAFVRSSAAGFFTARDPVHMFGINRDGRLTLWFPSTVG